MDTSALANLIFFLAFMGMILVHELGHYFASLWVGVEVEEFGFGLPPRAWTFWRLRGHFFTRSGKRIEIPRNFNPTIPWPELLGQELALTVDRVDDKLILRTMDIVVEETKGKKQPLASGLTQAEEEISKRTVRVGGAPGREELVEIVGEIHAGTEFTLNWLPLGGFVRPKGENDPNVPGGLAAARPWRRLVVLFAGPAMNLLAGLLIFVFLVRMDGYHDFSRVALGGVEPNSPAQAAGMRAGDIVLQAAGQPITSFESLSGVVNARLDQPVEFLLQRGEETITVTVIPRGNPPEGEGPLGIVMGEAITPINSWGDSVRYAAVSVYDQGRSLLLLPAKFLRGTLAPGEGRFIGLKGIADIFNLSVQLDAQSRAPAAASQQQPTYGTLYLIATLTISIGLFNLFPFPALDGGRVIFVIPEMLARRRVPHQFENAVHAAGMILLLLFMFYINAMDFIDPIQLPTP